MGKAEEYSAKKRNKAARKRLSNTVDFTHGIQAAKRRRKAGRRRICEGMCFSLPTPDDPFNDLYKDKLAKKKAKKDQESGDDGTNSASKEVSKVESHGKNLRAKPHKAKGSPHKLKGSTNLNKTEKSGSVAAAQRSEAKDSDGKTATDGLSNYASRKDALQEESSDTRGGFKWKPSCEKCTKKDSWTCVGGDAFEIALCALLNASIITDRQYNGSDELILNSQKVCMGSKWDWLFWEACGTGSDVLASGRAADTFTLAGSVLAAVAHITARRVHQSFFSSPLVLFIVQSKEQTLQVRSIFKVLKPLLGLHSVSLHRETPLQHQIEGY